MLFSSKRREKKEGNGPIMESLSLEEKIASFKKKIDDLDQSAPPPPTLGATEQSSEAARNGKIAAMKQRLVRKGLAVAGGDDGADGGDSSAAGKEAGGGDSDDESGGATEAEKAAKLAALEAEFEKGKIAAMKNRLTSMGLGLDGAPPQAPVDPVAAAKAAQAAAAKAAHAKAKADAAAAYAASVAAKSKGRGGARREAGSAGVRPTTPPPASAVTNGASVMAVETATEPDSPVANGSEAVTNGASATAVETATESDAPTPQGAETATDDAAVAAAVAADEPDSSVAGVAEPAGQPEPASDSGPEVSSEVTAAVVASSDDDSAKVDTAVAPISGEDVTTVPAAASTGDGQPAVSGDDGGAIVTAAAMPAKGTENEGDSTAAAPSSAVTPPPPPSNPQQQDVAAAASPAPEAAGKATGAKKAPGAGSTPSPKIEGFNVAASKAKAALAAAKSRTRSIQQAAAAAAASPSAGSTPQRQPRRRRSTPDRKATTPATAAKGASTAARKPSPARGRRQPAQRLSVLSTPVRVSPGAGEVSRAIPAVSVTPGLHPPAPGASQAGAPSPQRRRPASPARRKRGVSPAGSVTPARAAAASASPPPLVLTPASAEASGNRLHEQAREARERLERRRTEGGASPPFLMASPAPYTPSSPPTVLTLTPASAEASGNRLHEQAREARERLEQRRKETAVASPLTPMPGLVPLTPRRWSTPRAPGGGAGNAPSVTGVDRLESLYRDAIHRNSRLEMARKAEEEKPRECTFTPEISKRGRSLVRGNSGDYAGAVGEAGGSGAGAGKGGGLSDTFDALYQDAIRRREKMEALKGAQKEEARPPSPVITAMGRQAAGAPISVRMQQDAERWTRRWQELEEKRIQQEKDGCTFMPNFSIGHRSSSAPRLRPRRSSSGGGGGGSPGGIAAFVERSARFLEARERNMEKLKQEAEERERAVATFKPRILPWGGGDEAASAGEGSSVTGGADVFERLLRAAENQEMNKAALKQEFLQREQEQHNNFEVCVCVCACVCVFFFAQLGRPLCFVY